jgi:uncharacterized protein DUF4410
MQIEGGIQMSLTDLSRRMALLAIPALLSLLAACSSGVTRHTDAALSQPQFAQPGKKAGAISIALTSEAQKQAADNLKFNHETLLTTVRRALEGNDVLVKDADQSLPKIDIVVTDIRVRSAFSAVMFGFMAGDDHINGDVVVRSVNGAEVQRFSVGASYALGGLAGGQDETRMSWLYESFAKRVLEELTGRQPSS